MRRGDQLPEILDQIFELPIDWDFDTSDQEIPLAVLKEFSRLAGVAAGLTADSNYHAAISFLWQTRRFVGLYQYNSSDFIGTEINSDEAKLIMDRLARGLPTAANVIAKHTSNERMLSSLLLQKDRKEIFEVFLKKERLILRSWGLNQQSTEIILHRLRAYEFKILVNISLNSSLNSNKISECCRSLISQAKTPVAAYANGERGRTARSSLRTNLTRSKDKVVGIATLFGNVAPLVWGQGLDVASYISTAAGATAMAALPRGKPLL